MVKWWPEDTDYAELISRDVRGQHKSLLLFRACGVISLTFLAVEAIFIHDPMYLCLFFYSEWGALISWASYVVLLAATWCDWRGRKLLWLQKTAYVLFECAWTTQTVITIFFWCVLVVIKRHFVSGTLHGTLYMILIHICSMLLLFFDLLLSNMRFHIPHLVFVFIPAIVYMIVSIILAYSINFYAYPILTWKDALSVGIAFALLLLFFGSFFLGYWIGYCKRPKSHNSLQLPLIAPSLPTS